MLDDDLQVIGVADEYLRHLRFGRDAAESTTKAYAHSIALFLRWCARSGRSWQVGVEQFALFMTGWLTAGHRLMPPPRAWSSQALVRRCDARRGSTVC